MTPTDSKSHAELGDTLLQNRRLRTHRFFLGYAYDLFRNARIYTLWRSFLTYFRRLRMVAWTIKILSVILTVLETGALIILSTAIFLVLLPILTAFMLGVLLTALIESRKSNRIMKKALDGRQVYVLFLSKSRNPFLKQNARAFAALENSAVVVVSPYWISGRGLTKNRFFCTVRQEGADIYLVRRYYFFMLKKHVLSDAKTGYVY